jgi:hypothetical protein
MKAIFEAVQVRCSEMFMKDLNEKLETKIKERLNTYRSRCVNSIREGRNILSDDFGRKALKSYFQTIR